MTARIEQPPIDTRSIVYVVDDDSELGEALSSLLRSVRLKTRTFGTADELLLTRFEDAPSCILLDIRLPGINGLDFHENLVKAGVPLPVVFMTGHGDIAMAVRAMKAGAVDFLTKPFRDQDILDAVMRAVERHRLRREAATAETALRDRYEDLSDRERQVMTLVTKGLMNKQVAAELGLSAITVKFHRGHVMKKMSARSLAGLVRMSEMLGLHRAEAHAAPNIRTQRMYDGYAGRCDSYLSMKGVLRVYQLDDADGAVER
jgi:FixJ family two-component response regulator